MTICLDTSAYSQMHRGHRDAIAVVRAAVRVIVPAIVLGELRAGFRAGDRGDDNEQRLQRFLREPRVETASVDGKVALHYAGLWVGLRRAGTPIPTNDLWIAAVAVRKKAMVVTFDSHFERLRGVEVRLLAG